MINTFKFNVRLTTHNLPFSTYTINIYAFYCYQCLNLSNPKPASLASNLVLKTKSDQ